MNDLLMFVAPVVGAGEVVPQDAAPPPAGDGPAFSACLEAAVDDARVDMPGVLRRRDPRQDTDEPPIDLALSFPFFAVAKDERPPEPAAAGPTDDSAEAVQPEAVRADTPTIESELLAVGGVDVTMPPAEPARAVTGEQANTVEEPSAEPAPVKTTTSIAPADGPSANSATDPIADAAVTAPAPVTAAPTPAAEGPVGPAETNATAAPSPAPPPRAESPASRADSQPATTPVIRHPIERRLREIVQNAAPSATERPANSEPAAASAVTPTVSQLLAGSKSVTANIERKIVQSNERSLQAAFDRAPAAVAADVPPLVEPSATQAAAVNPAFVAAPADTHAPVSDARRSQFVSRLLAFAPQQAATDAVVAAGETGSSRSNVADSGARASFPGIKPLAVAAREVVEFASHLESAGADAVVDVQAPEASEAPAQPADVLNQLLQAFRVQIRDGGGDAVLRLNPKELGEVSISLRVENGAVSATITTEVDSVGDWIENQESVLRDGLEDVGLRLERFVVERDGRQQQQQEQRDPSARAQAARRRREAASSTFEITV